MFINLLISILGSETIKLLVRRATRALVERKGTSIDNELAEALLLDVASSKGNNISKDIISTVIEGAKSNG